MFKKVYYQRVHLASDEWASSGIMEKVAQEVLDEHKNKITADTTVAVYVCEHAGWWLCYTKGKEGLMVVGSANDAATWHGEKKEWRDKVNGTQWENIGPEIRRMAVPKMSEPSAQEPKPDTPILNWVGPKPTPLQLVIARNEKAYGSGATTMPCVCGHPSSHHVLNPADVLKRWGKCFAPDCGCAKFLPSREAGDR